MIGSRHGFLTCRKGWAARYAQRFTRAPPRGARNEAAYGLQHQARTAVLGPMLVVIVFAPFVNLPRLVQLEHPADRKLEREAAAIPVPAVEPLGHHLVAEAEEVEQLELDLFCGAMIEPIILATFSRPRIASSG